MQKPICWPAVTGIWALTLLASTGLAAPVLPSSSGQSSDASANPALTRFAVDILQSNPAVEAGRAALDTAEALARGAGKPLYNPALQIDTERATANTSFLGIQQAVDWNDKRGARARVADLELELARAEFNQVRLTLATELLRGLAERQTARTLHELAQRRADLMDRFAALSARRQQAGDIPQMDLDLARLAAAEAQLQQASSAATLAQSTQLLASIVASEPGTWPALPDAAPRLDVAEADLSRLLVALPTLRAAAARDAAARANVTLRSRERRPDPTLGIRGGREGSDALAGLTVTIPLYVRNNFRAEVDAASAQQRQAESTTMDLQRRAQARLTANATRYRLVAQAWKTWIDTGAPSLDSQFSLMQRLWEAGEVSTTDYLVQLRQALDTRASALELRGQLWSAWVDWLDASGLTLAWLGLDTTP